MKGLEKKKRDLEKLVMERTKELKDKSEKLEIQTKELDLSNKNLKTINKTKDKLFAIIAHDLKSPFNTILGMLSLLMEGYDSFDDAKKKEMMSYIDSSSKNLYKLLENLLEWARSQTGSMEFNPKPFVLMDVVAGNIQLTERQAEEKNIKVACTCSEEITVFADKNLLNTVFRNLLSNAMKFTRDGSITITMTKNIADNCVEVRIIDTGIGIEPERIKNIFSVSSGKTTLGTSGETGTGLGLILCKEFVERNGGKIYIESEFEKGSTFIFTIPLAGSN